MTDSPSTKADIIEAMARAISPTDWRLRDGGTFPLDHPASVSVVRRSIEDATAAYDAALPLITQSLAEKVRADKDAGVVFDGLWRGGMEYSAALIEEGLGQ